MTAALLPDYMQALMETADCDALIVGAGPSGSTAAFLLAAHGCRVLLLDRCEFPRPKLCGGLLTWKSIRCLARIFQTTPAQLKSLAIAHCETRVYRVAGRRGRALCRTLDYPFHLVERSAYDDLWRRRAVAAGAEFLPGAAVAVFDPARSEVRTTRGERFRGRFVIGADGVASRLRRTLAKTARLRPERSSERATALEARLPQRESTANEPPSIYYGFVPWGYGWSFPGPEHRLVGIAALTARLDRPLRAFFGEFLACAGNPAGAAFAVEGHGLPYGNYLDPPGWQNTLLLGDAAGLADPFLGEGIYYAHRSAELAAQAVLESFSRPERALERYRMSFRRFLLPELRFARAGRRLIFSLPPQAYYPLLSLFLRFAPKICEETIQGQRSFRWFRKTLPAP